MSRRINKKTLIKIIAAVLSLAAFTVAVVETVLLSNQYVFKINKNSPDKFSYAESEILNSGVKSDWNADWIWTKKCLKNSYVAFRKSFELAEAPSSAVAAAAADSKYKLWVNGEVAVLDGGLKRGPTYSGTYYENVELAPYLKQGRNVVVALVDYFGEDGFDHNDSGKGGFLFEAEIGGIRVSSGADWKAERIKNYRRDFFISLYSPNYRLAESREIYDAAGERDFISPDFDDSGWDAASVFGKGGAAPWNRLYLRKIPPIADRGIKSFLNSAEIEGKTLSKKTSVKLRLPYDAQYTVVLKVEAPAGKRLRFDFKNSGEKNSATVGLDYITKKGVNEYESFNYMSGDYLTAVIPKGVKIISLKYRESSYGAEITGSFASSVPAVDSLWLKAARSVYVNMRDNFTGCPDREKGIWTGDAANTMEIAYYSIDPRAYPLAAKIFEDVVGWTTVGGALSTSPNGMEFFELPMQNLALITSAYAYYLYTGDVRVLQLTYEPFKKYLSLFESEGLVKYRKGTWDWPDWGEGADNPVLENAWVYFAEKQMEKTALALGKTEEAAAFAGRAASLYGAFDAAFWNGEYYSSGGKPDDRANALAVCAGLASADKLNKISGILERVFNASPYMEKYVSEALVLAGKPEKALERILSRYAPMIGSEDTTLWEFWDRSGSYNHAWGGSPLVIFSKYFAGISPETAGYGEVRFEPYGFSGNFSALIPAARGNIRVEKDSGVYCVDADFSSDFIIVLPQKGDISINGSPVENFAYEIKEGKIEIKITDSASFTVEVSNI
jgi:Alpha-L-rhamnosidase N-terminal domain./Bacterial alpha-L-rhamnosidase.